MSHVRLLPLVVLGLSFTTQVAAAPKPIIEITEHIVRDTLWSADALYVITGEIHVRSGVQLVISDHTTILIRNGDYHTPAGNVTGKSALIFDSGSQLTARTLYLKAGRADNGVAARADNADYSGDDGVDIENSDLTLRGVTVIAPTEDGVNITSSRVGITDSLVIVMTNTHADDRDLFDMEWDDGRPFLRLMRNCKVDLTGIFGDEMTLISNDLPQPNGEVVYSFAGRLRAGQTYIYAHDD